MSLPLATGAAQLCAETTPFRPRECGLVSVRLQHSPDDPRVSDFVEELARERGETGEKWFGSRWRAWPWLVWSGPLPTGADEHAAVTALVCGRWWEFSGKGRLAELDESRALELLAWVLGHSLEGANEIMPSARAHTLAASFESLVPEPRRWYWNEWNGPPFPRPHFDANELAETDWDEVAEILRSKLADMPSEWIDADQLRAAAKEKTGTHYADVYSWNALTDHVWDTGVIAVAAQRAWIAWFTDDD